MYRNFVGVIMIFSIVVFVLSGCTVDVDGVVDYLRTDEGKENVKGIVEAYSDFIDSFDVMK